MRVCPSCNRHIREERCPFCRSDASAAPSLAGGSAMRVGMKRSAIVGVVLAAAACAPANSNPDADTSDVVVADQAPDSNVAAYGIPPDAAVMDAAPDGPVAAYGLPPDAGPPVDAVAPDSPVAAYGIPPDAAPPADARPEAAVAAYGIPPDAGRGDQ